MSPFQVSFNLQSLEGNFGKAIISVSSQAKGKFKKFVMENNHLPYFQDIYFAFVSTSKIE